jgi:hypothetical protein
LIPASVVGEASAILAVMEALVRRELFKDNRRRNHWGQVEFARRLSCSHDRSVQAPDGYVFSPCPRMHGQLLLARRAWARAVFTPPRSLESGRPPLWSGSSETRRNSVPRCLQRRPNLGRLPRWRMVLSSDSGAARANCSRAFKGWTSSGRCRLSSALALAW